ncbi:MAG TPA: response regulator [Candidatus Omnitrophota bacterium]|nr:response regulator [Candidatus Omnitrophota bacterium]
MEEKLLKVHDVMKKLNVSRRTIYYWINNGILKTVRIGNMYRFHPEDIEQLIASNRNVIAGSRKKILAIDDDILVRESIKLLLSRAGYSVTVVPDGKTAVMLARQEDFDLTLTDMRMPEMDGLETLKAIRKARQEAGKKLNPEIIMTAYEDSNAKTEAEIIGVRKFLMKPFELDYFFDVIQKNIS